MNRLRTVLANILIAVLITITLALGIMFVPLILWLLPKEDADLLIKEIQGG